MPPSGLTAPGSGNYDRATRAGDELGQYVQWCNAVEGNTTQYAAPAPSTVRRWAEASPAEFRFVFKLPRAITHERRLRHVAAELGAFCRLLEPLHDRLGPISVQLPASFGPSDLPVLGAFVRSLPSAHRWAIEVRHPDFFASGPAEERLDELCRASGVDRVVLDSRVLFSRPPTSEAEREAWLRKPRLPVRELDLAGRPVLRLIGRDDVEATRHMWEPWLDPLVGWLAAGSEPYVFVHTPDQRHVLTLACELHAAVRRRVPALAPLPEPGTRLGRPEQVALF